MFNLFLPVDSWFEILFRFFMHTHIFVENVCFIDITLDDKITHVFNSF